MKVLVTLLIASLASTNAWSLFGESRIQPHAEVTEECIQLARVGSCEFFTCLEERFPCGHDGYAIRIGKHFCERGVGVNNLLNANGQMFRNQSVACQTEMLLPVYESHASRCGDILDQGVSSMVFCSRQHYNGVDFCTYIRENMDAHNEMFELEDISRIVRLRNPALMTRLFIDGGSCGAQSLLDRAQALSGSFNDFIGTMRDSINNFHTRVSNWWNTLPR